MNASELAHRNHTLRLSRLQEKLIKEGVEAFLVNNLKNIRYLVDFTGTTGYLVVKPEGAILFVDPRYAEQARKQATAATTQVTVRDVLKDVLKYLRETRPESCAFESTRLTQAEFARIESALPEVNLVSSSSWVENMRAVKDAGEMKALWRALEIADAAYKDFLQWIGPGMSEREVAGRLEYFQRLQGADRKPSETVVASGPRTALPHGIATNREIQQGEPVMIDIGIVVDGYTSDLTRTVYLGQPPAEFEKIYRIVLDAQARAIKGIKPGKTGRQIDAIAREYIVSQGFGDYFCHALGHSLGLEIHERPQFSMAEESSIDPGMVITVEPGIYLPDRFGVRTEDTIVVTEDGAEVMTRSPLDLQVL